MRKWPQMAKWADLVEEEPLLLAEAQQASVLFSDQRGNMSTLDIQAETRNCFLVLPGRKSGLYVLQAG